MSLENLKQLSFVEVLLTHGARSVLRAASLSFSAGRHLDELRSWALKVQGRTNNNKAACTLANKLARICYATLRDDEDYETVQRLTRKLERTSYAMPA